MESAPNPFAQYSAWLDEAQAVAGFDPRPATLATAAPDGRPEARMVIIRGHDEAGFVFYTDRESPKAVELAENPRATLVFYWAPLERQIRVSGRVEEIPREQTEHNFTTRPRPAQLAAWIRESRVVANVAEVEAQFRQLDELYGGQPVPTPPFWAGYRLVPSSFDFWQGRPNWVHERLRYRGSAAGWQREALTP